MAIRNDGNVATTPLLTAYYWSSTEIDAGQAWCDYMVLGFVAIQGKQGAFYVRAIRAF